MAEEDFEEMIMDMEETSAIEDISEEDYSDPLAGQIVDFVKDNEIKVIFSEELVDTRLAEVIADEAGAEVLLFSPIEALAPEEVGKNITYLDKMEQNLDALKVALECQ